MSRALRFVGAAALALALTGCGEHNDDPREGRVTIDRSDCMFGDCYSLYKICLGPDLRTIYSDGYGDDDFKRIDKASPECEASND